MRNDHISARIEPNLKTEVHAVLDELGITPSQAIVMFYKVIQREHGLPFPLTLPNKETQKAIQEAREGKGVTRCKNPDDLFNDLEI